MNEVDTNINILPELSSLIPPLTPEEYAILENSIKQEGCRDALMLWGEILVDGHNRYEICQRYGIGFKTAQKCFNNVQEAKEWVIFNQFGRRNLNNYQRAELALQLENIYRIRAKENQGQRTDISPILAKSFNPINTREEVSKLAGISHGTLDKVKKIEARATDEVKANLRSGEISINQVFQKINGETNIVTMFTGNNEWYTPGEYIERARDVMGSIDLDPASCDEAQKVVKAKQYFTIETNGLTKQWFGNVFLNPPYCRNSETGIAAFTDKLINEFQIGNIKQAIVLTNNATDTAWFFRLIKISKRICLTKGRVHFYNGDSPSNPANGQIFFYIGNDPVKFKQYFSEVGLIMQEAS